jgi:hypothetical protein
MPEVSSYTLYLGDKLIQKSFLGDELVLYNPVTEVELNIVTDGLVLYMDSTNTASYPGTGASIFNLVAGKPITGSLVNTPTFKDNYLQFNGTNQYLQIPINSGTEYSLLFTTGSSTVMGAARYADTAGNGRIISTANVQTSNWLLGHFNNTTLNYYAEGTIAGTPGGPNDTNWRIYTGTANVPGSVYNFYVNGALDTGPSSGGARGPAGFEIGVANNNGVRTEYSSGSFAFVMLYNRVLTAAEVTQNYDALKSKVGLT